MTSVGASPARELRSRPEAGSLARPNGMVLWLVLLLAVATVVVYYPVNSHPFANYDDNLYVTDNLYVRSGL